MKLFPEEKAYPSKIYNIALFYSGEEAEGRRLIEYNGNLFSYELIYTLSGESITIFNEKKIVNIDECIEFLPKGIERANYTVERIIHGHCVDIFFDSQERLSTEALGFPAVNIRLRHLFEQSERQWRQKKPGYYARCMAALYEIISIFQESTESEYATNKQFCKIEKSVEYLEENCCSRDFSYPILAESSGLSYSYFKTLFKKKYGITPSRYVANYRAARARELLITGRYSTAQIAEMTGFENVYYFSTFFKKEEGTSPQSYVKSLKMRDAKLENDEYE